MITHVLPSASGETRRTSVKRLMRPTGASAHGLLQLLEIKLAELRHLGRDHQAAVALVRIAAGRAPGGPPGGAGPRGRGRGGARRRAAPPPPPRPPGPPVRRGRAV